jgi:hypothetical protein
MAVTNASLFKVGKIIVVLRAGIHRDQSGMEIFTEETMQLGEKTEPPGHDQLCISCG